MTLAAEGAIAPDSQTALADFVADCFQDGRAIYPVGGGTSLNFGLPRKQPGQQISTSKLNQIVDYPARDLTVTVEAGVTLQSLAELLSQEGQELPFDVPQAMQATAGGVVACNWNGPRRFGCGAVRDYVIGITAIDGQGQIFSGGGRVVKNVAGYDFCKLLTGSLGTLGIITQLTFKLRPKCQRRTTLLAVCHDLAQASAAVDAVQQSGAMPAAIELLLGPAWSRWASCGVLVLLEGTAAEVSWMTEEVTRAWKNAGIQTVTTPDSAEELFVEMCEFPTQSSPLVVKTTVLPSGVAPFAAAVRKIDPDLSLLAHAASGTLFVRFASLPPEGFSKLIVGSLQPLAARFQGHLQVIHAATGAELTRQTVWGAQDAAGAVMASVKRKLDPKNILNPGRFIFP